MTETTSKVFQPAEKHRKPASAGQGTGLPRHSSPAQGASRPGKASPEGGFAALMRAGAAGRLARAGDSLVGLQRLYGNRYVQRVVALARKGAGEAALTPEIEGAIESERSRGQGLNNGLRAQVEQAFGADFSRVRIHTDQKSDKINRVLNAQAFATGQNIFFRRGEYNPRSTHGFELLAHELTHVVQQSGAPIHRQAAIGQPGDKYEREADQVARAVTYSNAGTSREHPPIRHSAAPPVVQRRLIVTGDPADITDFIDLVEPAIGLQLEHDPVTNEIRDIGSLLTPTTSPAFAAILLRIINDAGQDAEINIGRGQAAPVAGGGLGGVVVGAFPSPADLTGGMVQLVDIDDILAIEAGAPGSGLAVLAHEIEENYQAHGFPVVAGASRFGPSHELAIVTEGLVAQDLVGPGDRVASVMAMIGSHVATLVFDYENYYLVFDLNFDVTDPAAPDTTISNARQASKVTVAGSPRTIDSFVTGSDAVPAAGAATVAAIVADLAANPTATVLIEGFTDEVGTDATNLLLSRRRAEQVRGAILAAGAAGGTPRFHIVGRGETGFVAPNNSEANRARNRRVVITVTRPGP